MVPINFNSNIIRYLFYIDVKMPTRFTTSDVRLLSSYRKMRKKVILEKRQRHETNLPFHHWMINNQKYFNRFVIRWVNKTNSRVNGFANGGWVWVERRNRRQIFRINGNNVKRYFHVYDKSKWILKKEGKNLKWKANCVFQTNKTLVSECCFHGK